MSDIGESVTDISDFGKQSKSEVPSHLEGKKKLDEPPPVISCPYGLKGNYKITLPIKIYTKY